jgi:adenylate cyclase
MKYSILGDTVNVAARLEGLNNGFGTDIAISDDVQRVLPEELAVRFRPMGEHLVKGRVQPVRVFALASGETRDTPGTGGEDERAQSQP